MELSDYFPGTHFTLAELIHTDQPANNTSTTEAMAAVSASAETLEQLRDEFGPLEIYSGYRSPLVNALVGGVPTSDHALGYAYDLRPTQISIYEMFSRIVNGPWKNQMREIFLKPSQGTLHLSFNTAKGVGKVMLMVTEGSYRALTQDEKDYYLGPVIPDSPMPQDSSTEGTPDQDASDEESGSQVVSPGISPLVWALGLGLLAFGVYTLTQNSTKESPA